MVILQLTLYLCHQFLCIMTPVVCLLLLLRACTPLLLMFPSIRQ
jgi:hypothetical protein